MHSLLLFKHKQDLEIQRAYKYEQSLKTKELQKYQILLKSCERMLSNRQMQKKIGLVNLMSLSMNKILNNFNYKKQKLFIIDISILYQLSPQIELFTDAYQKLILMQKILNITRRNLKINKI
ncbi:unnamed protein product [Paramecium sonneborni]|uniref:Uncharacterized protein n=1 Tax=Paramecium sonneborni TaxID=65129 RepID=A0A8S1R520_9CILI|nr:unnamed protein product [Paramecium sonneborni]CAD8122463.1 unnamed protein product [Paramecium sonneborni]